MTSYLERLKAKTQQKPLPELPTKPTKAYRGADKSPFVGFVGDQDRGFCWCDKESAVADFEERAAICEHDGGLSRADAEVLAALQAAPLPSGLTEETRSVVIDAAARFLDRRRRGRDGNAR